MPTRDAHEFGGAQRQSIRAAWIRYVVVVAGLGAVFLIVTLMLWPWPYEMAVEHLILPQYESRLGFQGGRLQVAADNDTYYGVVAVQPGGVLERAGVKAGDIPVEYHGGIWSFYGALEQFDAGERSRFDVIAQREWPQVSKRRTIELAPQLPGR